MNMTTSNTIKLDCLCHCFCQSNTAMQRLCCKCGKYESEKKDIRGIVGAWGDYDIDESYLRNK